jgi:hypothetical protein
MNLDIRVVSAASMRITCVGTFWLAETSGSGDRIPKDTIVVVSSKRRAASEGGIRHTSVGGYMGVGRKERQQSKRVLGRCGRESLSVSRADPTSGYFLFIAETVFTLGRLVECLYSERNSINVLVVMNESRRSGISQE